MANALLIIEDEDFELMDEQLIMDMVNKGAFVATDETGVDLTTEQIAENAGIEKGEEDSDYYRLNRDYKFTVEDVERLVLLT